MATTILNIPTPKQFMKNVRQWMKENDVGARQFAKLSKTSTGTLSKLSRNPEGITMTTMLKYQRVMRSYRPISSSHPKENPVSRASRHDSR